MTKLTEEGREARRAYLRRYRAEHREELNRKRREKYADRKEQAQASQARYWNEIAANKERERAIQDAYWERKALREAEYKAEQDKRAALLAMALRELAAFRRKYQQLDELADIFAAIEAKEAEK